MLKCHSFVVTCSRTLLTLTNVPSECVRRSLGNQFRFPLKGHKWSTATSRIHTKSKPYNSLVLAFGNEKLNPEKRRQDSIDSLGTWDTTTDLPLAVKESIASGKPIPSISTSSIGASSMKGRRTYNEDQYGFQRLNDSVLYFAVFDGHGGGACAKFCVNMFPKHVNLI